jgi:hypothetical protein
MTKRNTATNAKTTQSKTIQSKWTQKRIESLTKLFARYRNKPDWSGKIARQMHVFTANAVYKKAGRLGLISPNWVRGERENSSTLSASYRKANS